LKKSITSDLEHLFNLDISSPDEHQGLSFAIWTKQIFKNPDYANPSLQGLKESDRKYIISSGT